MSVLDNENILIENTKYGIDNPFYLLFNSFENDEFVYNVIEELGANREYYKCEKIRHDKWLLSIQDWNHIGKNGNIGATKFNGSFHNRYDVAVKLNKITGEVTEIE